MIDFSLTPRQLELQQSVRRFVREQVLPFERDRRWTNHGPTDELRVELNARAKAAGLLAPQAEPRFGGLGLTTDTLVERTFRELRAFRIYDGPSEVHRWSVGRKAVERAGGKPGGKTA